MYSLKRLLICGVYFVTSGIRSLLVGSRQHKYVSWAQVCHLSLRSAFSLLRKIKQNPMFCSWRCPFWENILYQCHFAQTRENRPASLVFTSNARKSAETSARISRWKRPWRKNKKSNQNFSFFLHLLLCLLQHFSRENATWSKSKEQC